MIKAHSPEPHLTHRPCHESPPTTRRHRRVALAWAALGLLGLLATVAPEQAAAQSEITLVGNAGQPLNERHTASFQGAVDHAQQFATGSDALGYTLTKVEFLSNDAQSHTFSAQLCEANNTGGDAVPDPMNCQTLSTTSSFAQGSVVVFTPPAGMTITLAASTRYVVVLSENNSPSAEVSILSTQANNQNGATGWTLANVFDWKQNGTTWMKQGSGRDALIMDVKGYANSSLPAAVSDVVVVPVRRTTDSLTVSWSAPDNAGKPAITGYDVRYRADLNWATVRQDDAASTSLIISGIANSYYDVQVRALNADGAGPWSSIAEGATNFPPETLFANNLLIPDDLGPGDSFRLLHITEDTTDATDTGIHHYHSFPIDGLNAITDPGRFMSAWGGVTLGQSALVSTPGADARQHTDTTWTETDRGVPIYWLNGARVADDYADFYDGVWADEANPTNDVGERHSLADPAPWTGTDHDGTELFDGAASRAVGQSTVGVGAPGSTASGAGPLNGDAAFASTEERPLYALWHVLVVGENLRLVTNINQPGAPSNDARAAVRAQLFTTGPHSSGYGISLIEVDRGSETDPFLGTVALHTTDGDGDPDLADGLYATLSLKRTHAYTWEITAPAGTVLKPSTTYALVFQGDAGTYPELWTTAADGEDVPADGWSLADALVYYSGSAWVENPNGRSLLIEIIGPALETDGPALVSATVGAAGNAVTLAFDEDLALPSDSAEALTFLASLASAFAVTADSAGVAVSGVTASGTDGLTLGLSGVIAQGQAVTLTYTDPTAGDDAIALQDGLGNDAATFTTGMNSVPDVINNSTISVPGAPTSLVATASGSARIDLSWTAPANDGGSAITGYRIEWSADGSAAWTELVANTANPITTHADTGLAASTSRHYRVSAINIHGAGAPSNVDDATTDAAGVNNPPEFSANTAARSVAENTAAGQNVGAVLTATDANSDTLTYTLEGADAASFDIASTSGQIRTKAGVTYNHEAKSTYTVIVKADDGNGGTDTITVTITVTDVNEPPGRPAAPSVAGTSGSTTSLDVTWTAPTNTGPAITSYDLQYREGASGSFTAGPQNETGTSAAIASLMASTSHQVQVRATNAEGDGDWSFPGTGRTGASVPGAPTSLSATASGSTRIDLSWTAPGSNGGSSITGYRIEISSDGGANWTVHVATTGNPATTYSHIGLAAGTTRHYRVSAINANGAGAASNTDTATTTVQTTVRFGAAAYTATEGGSDATVAVVLSAAPSAPVTIPLTKAHVGGAAATDYSSVPANVTFPTGQTRQTFTLRATDDSQAEGDERVRFGFGSLPSGYSSGPPRTATVTLIDDDAGLILSFGTRWSHTVKVRESDTAWHRFTVDLRTHKAGPLDGNPQQAFTIPLEVTHRNGAGPEDYTAYPGERDVRGGPEHDVLPHARDTGSQERDRRGPSAGLRPAAAGAEQEHLGAVRNDRAPGRVPARFDGAVRGRGVHGHGGRRRRAGVDPSERAGGCRTARCAAVGAARRWRDGGRLFRSDGREVRGGRADEDDHGDGDGRFRRRRRRERDAVLRRGSQRPGGHRRGVGQNDGGAGGQRRARGGGGVVRGGDLHGHGRRRRCDGERRTGQGARARGDGAADGGGRRRRDDGGLLRSGERGVRAERDVENGHRDRGGRLGPRRRREREDRVRRAARRRARGPPGGDGGDAGRRHRADVRGELRHEPHLPRPGARGQCGQTARCVLEQRSVGECGERRTAAPGDDPAGGDVPGRRDGGGPHAHPGERDV